jgi:hypothetical protein
MRIVLITCLLGLGLSSKVLAGIKTIELNPFDLVLLTDSTYTSLELCGERVDNGRQSCGSIQGFGYSSELDSKVWRYESLELDEQALLTRDSGIVLGKVNNANGGAVDLELSCKAKLSEYRYTLDEKIAAFVVTGNWPEASDSYSLYCLVEE